MDKFLLDLFILYELTCAEIDPDIHIFVRLMMGGMRTVRFILQIFVRLK